MKAWRGIMVLALAIAVRGGPAAAVELSGHAKVVDGDTFELSGRRVGLLGVDAPETGQICHTKYDKPYDCGMVAARTLYSIVVIRPMTCVGEHEDDRGRLLAVCTIGRIDVAEEMAAQGWAVAVPEQSPDYVEPAYAARFVRDGLWKGKFDLPAEWRRRSRDEQTGQAGQTGISGDD